MRPKTLLIDDERDFVQLLAARLEARDFPVLAAYDAAGGIALAESQSPAVVVLDVNLPDRSGLDVLREMRERWPLVQVVMLTGQSDVATAVAGMKYGAADYLIKPVDIDALTGALERAVMRRMDQEENMRMIETGKLAVLGRLAEGVAHEISNPVNIMMQKAGWASELLEDPSFAACPDLPEVRAELEAIVNQGRRCKTVVGRLMKLGGRIDPRASEFAPWEAVQAGLELVRERAEAQGVALSLFCEGQSARVFLPRFEIEQVVRRLAENALDAMPHGGSLNAVVRDQPPGVVLVELEDTGPGVPEAIAQRIFEPFFSTKEVGKGSGLGLSICDGIMKSLGGSVALTRPGGPGAVFVVTLPAMPVAE